MLEIIAVTAPYFALIAVGFLARGVGLMGEGSARVMNDFVLYFALPALLIRVLGGVPITETFKPGYVAAWGLSGVAAFVSVYVLSRFLFRQPGEAAAVHAGVGAHGNIGYLGLTLVLILLGPEATPLVTMAIIFDMVVIVPSVIVLLELSGRGGGFSAALTALKAVVIHPFSVAIIGGLALSLSGLTLPGPIDTFLEVLGAAAIPGALFAIGVTLYGQPVRGAVGELGALCFVKLLAHPLIVLMIATTDIFGLSREEIVTATLLASLPVATNIFVLATRYEARPGRVSGAIFASTLIALASFNGWAWLLLTPA